MVISVYLSATLPGERNHDIEMLMKCLYEIREDLLILGEWNCETDVSPVSHLVSTGCLSVVDDRMQGVAGTSAAGRFIDFALTRGDVVISDRSQSPGPADHHWVKYCMCIGSVPIPRQVWPKRLKLIEDLNEAFSEKKFEEK